MSLFGIGLNRFYKEKSEESITIPFLFVFTIFVSIFLDSVKVVF